MNCPYCRKDENVYKDGFRILSSGDKQQKYWCRVCDKYFSESVYSENPKLLYFDIETAPMKAWVWHTGKNYIRIDDIEQDWFVISWAAKWVCGNVIFSDVLTSKEVLNQDDRRICKNMWKLLDEADVVIGHNARNFDVKKMNWRFLIHGFSPPSDYKIIDTYSEARKVSFPSSYKLDFLDKELGLNDGKTDTDFELWKSCVKGDKKSLKKMVKYNKNDILIGEEIYMILRPWMRTHPNMGLYYDTKEYRCRNCGSTELNIFSKPYHTPANSYKSWRCKECGANGRTNIAAIGTDKRKSLLK